MFLDQELKRIREAKQRLAICGDLRRHLVQMEIQGIRCGALRTLSNLGLGLAVADQIMAFLRERKRERRS